MAYSQARPPPSMATSSARPLQLDQWANTKAPLTLSQRASVNRLAEWLHRNSSDFKQQQQQQQQRPSPSQPKGNEVEEAKKGLNATQNGAASSVNGTDGRDGPLASIAANDAAIALPDASAPLVSAQGFLAWYTQLSNSVTSSTQTWHRQALQRISEATSTADNLLAQLEACQVNVSELRAGTAFVQDSSRGIREQAQALLDSQTHLDTLAQDIASRLSFFTLLPYATNMLSSPDSSIVYSHSFLELMDQLDMALLFLQQEPARSYRDAALYRMRYSQCVTRAATLAKMAVVRDIKSEAERIADRVKHLESAHSSADAKAAPSTTSADVKGKARELSDNDASAKSEMPLTKEISDALFIDATHTVTKLGPLIFELQKRASNATSSTASSASTAAEFESLLQECRTAWYQHRRPLLSRILLQRITDIEAQTIALTQSGNNARPPIVQLAQAATELLRHVLQSEYQLYQQFFGGDQAEEQEKKIDVGFGGYLAELAETVTARLRPKLVKQQDLLVLSQTSAVIADAVHTNEIAADARWSQSLLPLLNETRARLLARAQTFITTDIAQFSPDEQQADLDFPERIHAYKSSPSHLGAEAAASAAGNKHRRGKSGAGLLDAALSASHAASSSTAQQDKVQLFTLPRELAETYYAPVRGMLELLFHLQARVDANAFRRIAVAAVEACLVSVEKGSQALVRRKKGEGLEREDGWLFELRQLEILREAVVSAELVLKQVHDEASSSTGVGSARVEAGSQNAGSASLVDLSSLVTAINSLWTNTGRLLYPSSSTTTTTQHTDTQTQTQSGQLTMDPCSTAISTKLSELINQIATLWSDAIIFPLRVYIDQPPATDDAGVKFRSTYQALQTCIESVIPEKAGKVALWVEDEEVQRMVCGAVTEMVCDGYGRFLQKKPTMGEGEEGEVEGVEEVRERVRRMWGENVAL